MVTRVNAELPAVEPPPPDIGDLNPASAQTRVQFGGLLREVLRRADRSYGDVVRYVEGFEKEVRGASLRSASSISDIINGKRLPRNVQVRLILLTCRVTDPAVLDMWEKARYAVAEREKVSSLPDVLSAREEELGAKAAELQRAVESLSQVEKKLWEDLARERAKAEKLEKELRRLRADYRLTDELKSKISQLEDLLEREQALVDQLKAELQRTISERRHAEVSVALVLAERNDTQIALSLNDAADLQFKRAEYERRAKEDGARKSDVLQQEIAELRTLLATYQAAQHDEHPTVPTAPAPDHKLEALRREIAELRALLATYQAAQHDGPSAPLAVCVPVSEPKPAWWRRLLQR
ncbi:hypothetical protein [Lentzea sp. CC55]|uniref:hypothetical protein n=1 Tax=Lentzea sp. CC55 TaxID=2884909 RepID=UPI001F17BCEA|nr:hypothetical protein [Lentzea sp. CC55]MCG8924151.1 hypothetical protein [Lentzea sp. CC55]